MENVRIYKCLPYILRSFLPFQQYKMFTFYLQKVGQGHRVQFSRLHLPSNDVSAKIVLRDLDIIFEDQKCKILISKTVRATTSMWNYF